MATSVNEALDHWRGVAGNYAERAALAEEELQLLLPSGERLAAALRPLLNDADEEMGHTPETVREAEDALTAWEAVLDHGLVCSGSTGTADKTEHPKCGPGVECPCSSALGNKLLRELLTAMGWNVPARPEAPSLVWAEALRRVKAKFDG